MASERGLEPQAQPVHVLGTCQQAKLYGDGNRGVTFRFGQDGKLNLQGDVKGQGDCNFVGEGKTVLAQSFTAEHCVCSISGAGSKETAIF